MTWWKQPPLYPFKSVLMQQQMLSFSNICQRVSCSCFSPPMVSYTTQCVWECVLVSQSCPTLCDPMDCSQPVSSVHGILQARVLKWVDIPFSNIIQSEILIPKLALYSLMDEMYFSSLFLQVPQLQTHWPLLLWGICSPYPWLLRSLTPHMSA